MFKNVFVFGAAYLLFISVVILNYCNCEISKKPDRFLTHIFNKYGSNGTISFEVSKSNIQ